MSYTSVDKGTSVTREVGLHIPFDGELISATRYSPAGVEGPLPAVLMYFPYRKDDHLIYGAYAPIIEYTALHGYHVITADMVGTGGSTGRKQETGAYQDEGPEAVAIIEWLAEQPWCSGSVGMFGKSYGGSNCLSAAVHDPEPLEAIVPIMAGISTYEEVGYPGGLLNAYGRAGHWNAQMLALQTLPTSVRDTDRVWADAWKDHLTELEEGRPWMFNTLDHPRKDAYWQRRETPVERISVPTFAVSGWRDHFPAPTLEFVERIEAPVTALLGPWRHAMPHRARETVIDFRPQVVQWFDHHLKGADTGVDDWPVIRFWTEREGGGVIEGGTWRGTETWPPGDERHTFALTADGLTQASAFDSGELEERYEHDHSVGMYSPDDRPFAVPADVAPDDARSLCFETDPLETAVELTGSPEATIRLESTVADPLLAVRLVDVAPGGQARLVSHGRLRLEHRNGHTDPDPVEPGEEYTVELELKPKSHVFEPGHRIRLAISAAFFPIARPTAAEPGAYLIRSSPTQPSTVEFPGTTHDDGVSFGDTLAMGSPDTEAVPTSSPYAISAEGGWSTERDQLSDQATVRSAMVHSIDLPHGGTMSFDQQITAEVDPSDPQSFIVHSTTEAEVAFEPGTARTVVSARVDSASTHFAVETTFDDKPVFEQRWRY